MRSATSPKEGPCFEDFCWDQVKTSAKSNLYISLVMLILAYSQVTKWYWGIILIPSGPLVVGQVALKIEKIGSESEKLHFCWPTYPKLSQLLLLIWNEILIMLTPYIMYIKFGPFSLHPVKGKQHLKSWKITKATYGMKIWYWAVLCRRP